MRPLCWCDVHLIWRQRNSSSKTFAAFSPASVRKHRSVKIYEEVGWKQNFFPLPAKVLIKNSKTALSRKKTDDIKHRETNITDVTSKVGLNKADT